MGDIAVGFVLLVLIVVAILIWESHRARRRKFDAIEERMSDLERQLQRLTDQLGVAPETPTAATIPPSPRAREAAKVEVTPELPPMKKWPSRKTLYVGTEEHQKRLQGSAPPAKGEAFGKGVTKRCCIWLLSLLVTSSGPFDPSRLLPLFGLLLIYARSRLGKKGMPCMMSDAGSQDSV